MQYVVLTAASKTKLVTNYLCA